MKAIKLILTAFVSLTAIGGGIALMIGIEDNRFPLTWLDETPFTSYFIPGLILAGIVGGMHLFSFIQILRKKNHFIPLLVSSFALIGFITVEMIILKQSPPAPTIIELFYISVGLVILLLAIFHKKTIPKNRD
jgi:peptidoglycan/LPS O-acetylase OafA/YrhL